MAFENIVLLWRIKAPRAADEPYGEASFRTFTSHSLPLLFPEERRPSRPPVPERDHFCTGKAIYDYFFTARESCTHFPLAFTRRPGATPLLGRRLRAGRTFASPFLEFPESMVVLEAACPLWGGHLQVLDDEASLW